MNCSEFWKRYEQSGLTPGLEQHLKDCIRCRNELVIDRELEKTVQKLQRFKAPEGAWEGILSTLNENNLKDKDTSLHHENIWQFFRNLYPFTRKSMLKPVVVGIALSVLITSGLSYYYLLPLSFEKKMRLQARAIQEMEKSGQEYLAAIEKFSGLVEKNKDVIDPELSDLYQEKLALLDEYIQQCKEAISENEYNGNARKYLALAYKEKAETLMEMSGNVFIH